MASFIQYLKDTRGELRHVAWPTQKQTFIYTTLVIILSLLTAAYIGALDFGFTRTLDHGLDVETSNTSDFTITPEGSEGSVEITPAEGEGTGDESGVEFEVVPTE